ncbi:uncharacterized protein LOC124120938 [Haliotis rufescens]|uniref:uncharacterized protein LOC124120938 n=1 Tax=Haliotis rufescens TaxID=6454 RepID=UPI001EB0244D|nr:uncharacterized protein LOC124120938 [Haliotis rufescens]XP_046339806.1 uncharacterized protein LOC124120938 [Haliotis rufescens]XP_046339807.1 uncharacterized protein LOC124120938 [Haliotis rufescens]XP_046339808.1 uncharacterized protein LOC124120938 [Haliotis rufescens]XP_046339809.1 uncharacterized protein LOC124120938 [Haliotis rufescens]XP_046339810.1 uncharacterized protein LOC124120938 [Haliotis rufescens]XP_048243383.1 uncharacterized protein LOC124120938 [Haliotis rufescens]XP_0
MSDLISAAKNGYHDNVENLLSLGSSTEACDKDDATALYWGACRGHWKICETLLKSRCRIDARVKWGSSALHAAADRGHLNCVNILVTWGANLNLQNNRGDTPLHLAAYRGFADIVDAFIAAAADPFVQNESCKTPLQEAVSRCHTLAASKLQQYMASQQIFSSLPNSGPNSDCMDIYQSMAPTSWPKTKDFSFIPNIRDSTAPETSKIINSFSNPHTSPRSLKPICQVPPSIGNSGQRSMEAQENTEASNHTKPLDAVNGRWRKETNGSCLLQTPHHDYHETPEAPTAAPKMAVTRSKSSHDDTCALENFAESLQLELVKYSERVLKVEQSNVQLQNKVREMEKLNRELLWQQEQKSKDLQNTREMLATERRKNFEVVKQQKLIARSMSSSMDMMRMENGRNSGGGYPQRDFTHKHLLTFMKTHNSDMCNSRSMLDNLRGHLQTVWLPPASVSKMDSNVEWVPGMDYDIIGDGPLNHVKDGVRNGSCSLVFQIRRNATMFILKMMVNLINLDFTNHDQGCSLDGYLIRNFGPEYHVPLLLSKHRNIVSVMHYYQGSTDQFRRYQDLLVPSNLDVPLEMATRTSFLVLESYPQTLLSFMVNQRTICPEPCYGLPNVFLLLLLYQMLSVIDFLQCNHIVHRDIKGDNVFLDKCLRPVLADFGFARSLYTAQGLKQVFVDKTQACAGNSNAWAPELTRFHHNGPESLPHLTSLQEVYAKTDGFAVSRMFYSLLRPLGDRDDFPQSSVNKPHYFDSAIPDLPVGFSQGLCDVLKQLVLDDPQHRPTARKAMIRVGVMLFAPAPGEVESLCDVSPYLEARALKLLAVNRCGNEQERVMNVEESIAFLSPEVEASLLVNVTAQEFWEEFVDLKDTNLLTLRNAV